MRLQNYSCEAPPAGATTEGASSCAGREAAHV